MTTPRRLVLPGILLAGTLLSGCSPSTYPDASIPALPAGGVNATVGQIHLDDVWLDAPHGVAAGTSAPLRLVLANDSTTTDALVRVSTPVAGRVTLVRDGHPVDRVDLPAGQQVNMEWDTGVLLQDLRRPMPRGQPFPVTLSFARAGAVTVSVTAGPLG